MADNPVKCFYVEFAGFGGIINGINPEEVKNYYALKLRDLCGDDPIDVKVEARGEAHTSPEFERVAKMRGMNGVKCGQRVKAGQSLGYIVGFNSSANFDVLFDDDAPKYAGQRLNCHPHTLEYVGTKGWVVEIQQGVWLAPWEGNPGRTVQKCAAQIFNTWDEAKTALQEARKIKPYAGAAIWLA